VKFGQGYTENNIRLRNHYTYHEEKQKHQKRMIRKGIPAEIIISAIQDNQYETVIMDRAECIESNYNKDKEEVLQLTDVDQSVSLRR